MNDLVVLSFWELSNFNNNQSMMIYKKGVKKRHAVMGVLEHLHPQNVIWNTQEWGLVTMYNTMAMTNRST